MFCRTPKVEYKGTAWRRGPTTTVTARGWTAGKHQRGRQGQGNYKRYEESDLVSLTDVERFGENSQLVAAEPAPVESAPLDTAPAVDTFAVPAPAAATDVPILTRPIAMGRDFDIPSLKRQAAVRRAYARMDTNVLINVYTVFAFRFGT